MRGTNVGGGTRRCRGRNFRPLAFAVQSDAAACHDLLGPGRVLHGEPLLADVVLLDLGVEGGARDAEQGGGLGLLPAGLVQGAGDQLALGLLQREVFAAVRPRPACGVSSLSRGSMMMLLSPILSVVSSRMARSITLRSSRTLPGQSCWHRASRASGVMRGDLGSACGRRCSTSSGNRWPAGGCPGVAAGTASGASRIGQMFRR